IGCGGDGSVKHDIDRSSFGKLFSSALRMLAVIQRISASADNALATIDQRIVDRIFMAGILPDQSVQDDRRIETFDVVALVNHPAPPCGADIVAEFSPEGAVVPRA